jgi:ABC-type lipoprotein release transport system permease subunit
MKLSFKAYIRYLRKQKAHVQHVHAIVFAGTITLALAVTILYVQYGYWHGSYERKEVVETSEETVLTETPKETLVRLFAEGKTRFNDAVSTLSPLEGGEVTFDRNATTTR